MHVVLVPDRGGTGTPNHSQQASLSIPHSRQIGAAAPWCGGWDKDTSSPTANHAFREDERELSNIPRGEPWVKGSATLEVGRGRKTFESQFSVEPIK
jgi:hypothetical protein